MQLFNTKNLNTKKIIFTFLMPLLVLLAVLSAPHKAHAAPLISNVAPVPSSGCIFGTNCATTTNPWFAVGVGAYDGLVSYAKIYVPAGSSAITVVQGGGVCGIDVGSPNVTYNLYSLDNDEGVLGLGFAFLGSKNNASFGCGSFTMTASGGIQSNVPGHTKYKVFYLEAVINNSAGTGDHEKNFRLSANNGAFVGVSRPVKDWGSKPWFGIYQRDAPSYGGANWNWSVNYGPRCSDNSSPKTAAIHDIDWQVYNQPFLKASVMQDSRTDTGVNWTPAAAGGAYPTSRYQGQFSPGTGTENPLSWSSDKDHRYGIFFQDIDWHNTIQISIPFDQIDGTSLVTCPTPTASCTATPSKTNPLVGQGVTMTIKVANTSAPGVPTYPTSYEIRQISYNGSPAGGTQNLNSSLPPGQSETLSPPFNIAARASPQSVTFYYALFNGGSIGADSVGANPLCHVTVRWGSGPSGGGPNGNIAATCSQTTISGVNLNDNWHAPAGASPTIPPRSINAQKVTNVPVRVHVTGNGVDFYYYPANGAPNNGNAVSFSTYNMGDSAGVTMWAHMSYHIELEVQGDSITFKDSLSYNNDGKWTTAAGATYYGAGAVAASDDSPSDCLDASCGGQTPADVEPGQSATFHYTVNVTNQTQKSYNDNNGGGYNFTVSTSGGFTNVGGSSASPDPFGSGSVPIDINFPARLDYTGDYTVTFNFQGSQVALNSISPCPAEETPSTRPFFEVRAGDISTGGGFTTNRSGSNSCANPGAGDSAYISPNVTGYNYSGDIRAFSRPNQNIGSLAQFGTYSLGLTIGTIGGPIGFYSADNALFANTSSPTFSSIDNQGYTGYLNSSPSAHCTPVDFFNSTRTTTSGFSGDLTSSPSGQYTTFGTTINGGTIGVGKQITLYVDGDLTINGNITYASAWNPNNQSDIPYLIIIARGNITLTNNVRQLDGLYIAQPNGSSGGHFDTCDSASYCPSGLIVNGAIIAQQVDLLRASGSLGPCDAASSTCNLIGNGPAEVINYAPSMVIGLPNILQNNSGAIIPSGVEGIFSLPPVF